MKKNNVSLYLTFIMFLGGIGCFLLSMVLGSSIDSEGFLHEPFFLIPIGYLLIALGIVSAVVYLFRSFRKHI